MFIFRRLIETDINFKLITGNKVFDELSSDGTLIAYIDQEVIKGGNYYTYLLLEQEKSMNYKLLGLLRYRFTNINPFIKEL